MTIRTNSVLLAGLALAVAATPATAQSGQQQIDAAIAAMAKVQDASIPIACDVPAALVRMMVAMQSTVGDRIHRHIVNILDPKTISRSQTGFKCQMVTVWDQGPPVFGIFTQYQNAIGARVFAWNGLRAVPGYPGSQGP